jgi:hypothetical protein
MFLKLMGGWMHHLLYGLLTEIKKCPFLLRFVKNGSKTVLVSHSLSLSFSISLSLSLSPPLSLSLFSLS